MSFQKGDLVYVPELRKYPEEYILVIERKQDREESTFSDTYSVFSLTENRKDYYNAEWLDTKAKKIG
jgi:hypothetical protein